ncbi:UNVERIFIED_CONTAM: hypothetical protein RMT77_002894 [Armadillidium vulgare]
MKGENFSSQRELFVEREVSAFQDSSSLPYQEVIEVTSSFDTAAISTTNITTAATSEECSLAPASMLVNSHDVAFIEKMKDLEEMDSELIKNNEIKKQKVPVLKMVNDKLKETTSVRLEQSTPPLVIQKMEFLTKAITDNMEKIYTIVSSDEQDLENNPVEAEENKVVIKSCRKLNVQVKLEEERTLEEGEASDNSVTPSDNYKQITEMIVIKSEVENSSQDGASIIKRRKLGTIQSKNPISTLNEFYPELKYKVINQLGPSHDPTFTAGLELNGQHFKVSGRTKKHVEYLTAESALKYLVQIQNENDVEYKMLEEPGNPQSKIFKFSFIVSGQRFEGMGSIEKLSKTVAAKEALSKLFGLIIPSPMDLHHDPLTSHPNLHMPQNLADKIAKNGCEKLFSLTSEKSTLVCRRIQQIRLYKYRRKGKVMTR